MSDVRPTNVRVEYSVQALINMGNFSNVTPGYKISADVPDGTHPNEVKEKLQALADSWVEKEINEYLDIKLSQLGG